jgi:hypothetical protein
MDLLACCDVFFLFFSTPGYSSLVWGSTFHGILHRKTSTKTLFSLGMFFKLKKRTKIYEQVVFTPQTNFLHKQFIITQTTHNYLTLAVNQFLCITNTHFLRHKPNAKTNKSSPNTIELNPLLMIQNIAHLSQHKNPSPKHRKPKHLHNEKNYKT